jgi:hypothetical protein
VGAVEVRFGKKYAPPDKNWLVHKEQIQTNGLSVEIRLAIAQQAVEQTMK